MTTIDVAPVSFFFQSPQFSLLVVNAIIFQVLFQFDIIYQKESVWRSFPVLDKTLGEIAKREGFVGST